MVDKKQACQIGLASLAIIIATIIGLSLMALKRLSSFYYSEMAED